MEYWGTSLLQKSARVSAAEHDNVGVRAFDLHEAIPWDRNRRSSTVIIKGSHSNRLFATHNTPVYSYQSFSPRFVLKSSSHLLHGLPSNRF
jgi:hypothetical protein